MTPATAQPEKSQPTYQPVRKATVGAFTGALVTLTVLILNTYHPFFQNESKKISGEIFGAATTILTFIVSYLIPPSREEAIAIEEGIAKLARK